MGSQALQQDPVCAEHINEPIARPLDVVVLGGVLHRVGHEYQLVSELVLDCLDAERGKPGWDLLIAERPGQRYRAEVAIEDVDRAGPEIRCVEMLAGRVGSDGQTLVYGAICGVRNGGIVAFDLGEMEGYPRLPG